jgi:hypothetical protein
LSKCGAVEVKMAGLSFQQMNRLSLVPVRIEQSRAGRFVGHGTGFLVRPPAEGGQVFLVTAWHVATMRDPKDPSHTIGKSDSPDSLWFQPLIPRDMDGTFMLPGYRIEITPDTVWREHIDRQAGIDLVAFHLPEAYRPVSFPLPWTSIENGVAPVAGTDAVIVGFPFKFKDVPQDGGDLDPPIWKRATVASEPGAPAFGNKRYLVDALSRPGMSGAPIFRIRHDNESNLEGIVESLQQRHDDGDLSFWDLKLAVNEVALLQSPAAGQRYEFVGVYTGRLTAGGSGLDLGIAHTPEAVAELFHNGIEAVHPLPQTLPDGG